VRAKRHHPWSFRLTADEASVRVGSVPDIDDAPGYAGHRGYRRSGGPKDGKRGSLTGGAADSTGGNPCRLLARQVIAAAADDAQSPVPAIADEARRFLVGEGEYGPNRAGGAVRAFWCHVGDVDADRLAMSWRREFEAAALAIQRLKACDWIEEVGPGVRLEVEVRQPATRHELTVAQVRRWCESTSVNPDERIRKDRARALLG
jgi:hypothetical protein